MIKTAYAASSPFFGNLGIGRIAYHAVLGLLREGMLGWVACRGISHNAIPKKKLRIFSVPPKRVFPFLSDSLYSRLAGRYFDWRVANHFAKEGLSLFHGWNGNCLLAVKRAKSLGLKTVLERASTHPLYQKKLLEEEYSLFGVPYHQDDVIHERCLLELGIADHILVPSEPAYDSFRSVGFPDMQKLHMIPFGVDVGYFSPSPKPEKPFTVLFAGQVSFRKGVLYLLRAWKKLRLKEAQLFIVGGVHEDIKRFLEEYEGNPGIIFTGHQEDLKPLYDKAHLCVFPSIEEGSALVSYEAMACGIPVVATSHVGAYMTHQREGRVVPVRDVDAISEAILFFYENPEKRKETGAMARFKAEKFSWERYGENMAKAYQGFLQ